MSSPRLSFLEKRRWTVAAVLSVDDFEDEVLATFTVEEVDVSQFSNS